MSARRATKPRAGDADWIDTPGVITLLRKRFDAPAFCFLEQVRNGTGWEKAPRTADALAMGTWPSRGLHLHGFEVKVSRHDWLRELKNPAKAEAIVPYCDFWWVVAGFDGCVELAELPGTWGLLAYGGGKLRVVREAPKLDAIPLDRVTLAAILRNVQASHVARSEFDERLRGEVDVAVTNTRNERDWASKRLRESVEAFEAASGVKIADVWDADEIGEAVKLVRESGVLHARRSVERLRNLSRDIANQCERALAEQDETAVPR